MALYGRPLYLSVEKSVWLIAISYQLLANFLSTGINFPLWYN